MDDPPAAATSLLDRLGAEPVPVEEPAHDEELLAATPLDGLVGLDRALEAEDPIDSDHTRRPDALFVTAPGLASMETDDVLQQLLGLLDAAAPRPNGLEWVNDTSIVLLFDTASDAEETFMLQTGRSLFESLETASPLQPFLLSPEYLVRPAVVSDIKQRNSARVSSFYSEQRRSRQSRKSYDNDSKPYDRPSAGRWQKGSLDQDRRDDSRDSRRSRNPRREKAPARSAQELDDELDAYLRGA